MRYRFFRRFVLALIVVAPVVIVFSIRSKVASSEAPALVPVISATKTAALVAGNGDADADPGDTIEYTITVNNTGPDPATGLVVADQLVGPQSLVAGSPNILPNARNDTYQTIGNTQLQVAGAQTVFPSVFVNGNVKTNDVDFGGGTFNITAFDAATTQGGTVTMNMTDGTFVYTPDDGDANIADTFTYTITDNQGATDTATVTINITAQKVWYVRNNQAAGGLGRSGDPFDTLVEAQTASVAGDTIYVFNGNNTTTGQAAGIVMKANQRLIGAGVALTVPVSVNGGPNPTVLLGAGTAPLIDNTAGNAVAITNITGVLVTGLNIGSTNNSAVDISTTGANNAGAEIALNTIRNSTAEGIDVNGVSTGTTTVSIHDNTITSTGNGIDIVRTAGTLNVTAFDDNVITGTTGGIGINIVGAVTFDAIPGGAFNTVSGGNTVIGASGVGNGVGGAGLVLTTISGDLAFTDLDIFADGGTALTVAGTGTFNGPAGSGTRLTVTPAAPAGSGTSTVSASAGAAVSVSAATIDLRFADLDSATAGSGVSLSNVDGQFNAPSGSSITKSSGAGTAFSVASSNATVSYAGTLNVTSGGGVSLTGNTGSTISFSGGMTLSTGANAAFTATGPGPAATSGGTVNVCDENPCGVSGTNGALVNTLTTTTGTALNVANTTIGASNLEIRSVSQNGGANSIILNNTGSTGGLKVKGDGSTGSGLCTGGTSSTPGLLDCDGSGGTIQNTTADAVSLTNASNVTLRQMNITNAGWDGVHSNGGSNIVLSAVNINHPGDDNPASNGSTGNPSGFGGGNGWFAQGNSGVNSFDNNSRVFNWQSSQSNGIVVLNTNTNFTSFTVDNAFITTSATGAAGFHVNANGTTSGTVNLTDTDFTLIDQNAAQVLNNGSGAITSLIQRNNFHDADATGGDGNNTLFLALAGSGDLNFTIGGPNVADGNTFSNLARLQTLAGIVQVNAAGGSGTSAAGAQLNGTIQNNTITNTAFVGARRGIMVAAEASAGDHGGHTVAILNNSVQGLTVQGIYASLTSVGGFDLLNNNFTISNNLVGTTGAVGQGGGDGGSAIEFETNVDADNTGAQISTNVLIQSNTATSNNNSGIGDTLEIANRSGNNLGTGNSSTLNLTIFGNNLTQSNAGGDVFQISNSIMTTTTVNVDLNSDNVAANRNTFTGGDADGVLLRNDAGTFRIEDLVGGAEAFVEARNTGNFTVTGTIVSTGEVTLPTNPSFFSALEEVGKTAVEFEDSLNLTEVAHLSGFEILTYVQPVLVIREENGAPDPGVNTGVNKAGYFFEAVQFGTEAVNAANEIASKLGELISPTVYAQVEPETGESFTTTAFTLPAGESVTVKFRVTVDNGPYASGLHNITNTANISGTNFTTVNASSPPMALDAAPDLVVVVSDSGVTTEPGVVLAYSTTFSNATATNGQDAGAVRITLTVPTNTTFNATVSGLGWSCPDGSAAGTVCTFDVGAVNAGAPAAALNFAVNVLAALPAGAEEISDTATIAENPANFNGPDRDLATNTSTDTTDIIGNWDGSNGAAGTGDWNDPLNWSNNIVPPDGNNISVPDVANAPAVISQDVIVGLLTLNDNLSIAANRTVTATGEVSLGTRVVDGLGTLEIDVDGTLTRTTGQVQSTLNKVFDQPDTFIYHVGTPGEYSPVIVVVTSLTAATGELSVRANDGPVPSAPSANTLQRYWTLEGSGITADVTFNYLDSDVVGLEPFYRTVKVEGTTATVLPNQPPCPGSGQVCVDPDANTITVRGLTSFSNWSASEIIPTAGEVTVSGRVLSPNGRGLAGVNLVLSDAEGNRMTATTNPFGFYRFENVPSGKTYILTPLSRRFQFTPQVLTVNDDMEGVNFAVEP